MTSSSLPSLPSAAVVLAVLFRGLRVVFVVVAVDDDDDDVVVVVVKSSEAEFVG